MSIHQSVSDATLDTLASHSLKVSEKRERINDAQKYSFENALTDIDTIANKHGLKRLGVGSSRVVYAADNSDSVIKLPLKTPFSNGNEHNRVEEYIYNHLPSSYTDSFFEVMKTGDDDANWLAMKRADATEDNGQFNVKRATMDMYLKMSFLPEQCELFLVENIGYSATDNEYKCLDYGSYIPKEFVVTVLGQEHIEAIGQQYISG